MYLSNFEQFQSTAKFWTDCYARPKEVGAQEGQEDPAGNRSIASYDIEEIFEHMYIYIYIYIYTWILSFFMISNIVARLMDMGFPKDKCINALRNADGDENTAVAMLCSEF